ncbi:MAG: hypothetical protein LUG51_01260 [Tannerellaceae bacterium]|nr:hypothetical protein [Tannerellaceae bacterium]
MALRYHLVSRRDLRKNAPEGAKLYYGQTRSGDRIELPELSEAISALSTASEGDVTVVLEGLLMLMRQHLVKGNIVELGDLGNFRMVAGSPGVTDEEEFHTSLFKKGHIVYTPGIGLLRFMRENIHYEKLDVIEVEDPCKLPHAI